MCASAASASPPSATGAPAASSRRAPSAAAMPAPPSFVALPPMQTTRRFAPASIARAISSPVPRVVAASTSRRASGTRARPDAVAISITPEPAAVGWREAERRIHRVAEGSGHGRRHDATPERLRERLHRALAAVGHRHEVELVAGAGPLPPGRDRLRCLTGRQRAAELVGGHEDAHGSDCTIRAVGREVRSRAGRGGRREP